MSDHLLVLIAGGHSSGKTDVANYLENELKSLSNDPSNKAFPIIVKRIDLIKYDRLEYDLTYREKINENAYKPTRFDFDRLINDLDNDDDNSTSTSETEIPATPTITILTGTYALYDKRIREKAIMKVYLDVDNDTRLSRLILTDVKEDHSKLGSLLDTYLTRLRPEMSEYIAPTKRFADVILTKPASAEGGEFGVQLIASGVYDRIKQEYYNAPDSTLPTLTIGKPSETPFRYRRESFVEQKESYYSLN